MQKKNSTETTGKAAQIIRLADYRKSKVKTERPVNVELPADRHLSDIFILASVGYAAREYGLTKSHTLLIYVTDDVQRGDVVAIKGTLNGVEVSTRWHSRL